MLEAAIPYNRDAERAVLGTAMQHGDRFPQLAALLMADDFHQESHKRIWRAMQEEYDAGSLIAPVTVATRLHAAGLLESVGGVSYLVGLDEGLTEVFGGEHYCRLVKQDSIRRRAIFAAQKLQNDLLMAGDSSETLVQAERLLRELGSEGHKERCLKSVADVIADRGGMDAFLRRSQETGIPTRWPWLNDVVSGWRPQQLILVAARPSVGKTALALDTAEYAAMKGYGTVFFSLEMPTEDLTTRLACGRAKVDWNRWRHNALDVSERRRLGGAVAELAELPLWFDDTANCTVPAIHASLRKLKAQQDVQLVVIDYLQLLQPVGKYGSRNDAVSAMSRELKLAAREFNIPFIVLSQLTRGPEHEKRKPILSDLRDSGGLEQDADVVVFVHRKGQDYSEVRPCEFIVAKQRNGPIGCVSVNFMSKWARFEISTDPEEEEQ